MRELCRRKEVEIIEAEACPDHIHIGLPHKRDKNFENIENSEFAKFSCFYIKIVSCLKILNLNGLEIFYADALTYICM